jgi:uncharacterized protein with HEPN domain
LTQRDDAALLRDMLNFASRAREASAGRSRTDLDDDPVLTAALERFVELIGEAASRLSRETRNANPQVQWREMIALRNRLVHGYFTVDLEILWNIVQDDIPTLINALERSMDTE